MRFADDIVIIAESEEDLKQILRTMEQVMEEDLNIKINVKKLKIIVCSRKNNIRTNVKLKDDKTIEQVENFLYLGGNISFDGRCKKGIKKRICQAMMTFNKKISIFT